MAKLSARGRTILAEVSKEEVIYNSALINWGKTFIALMSDGEILRKRQVMFLPDRFNPNGRKHDYGWKVEGKAKAGLTAEEFVQVYVNEGYVRVK